MCIFTYIGACITSFLCTYNAVAQGSTCLEVGVYMLNYAGCHACKSKSFIDATEKSREEEEGGNEESITYKRM